MFRNHTLSFLPHVLLILYILRIILTTLAYSIPWITDDELENILEYSDKTLTGSFQSSPGKKFGRNFESEYNEGLARLNSINKVYKKNINHIGNLYDILSEQVKNIGFNCPTTYSIKRLYCDKKKLLGFSTEKERRNCEKDLKPSLFAYSFQSSEFSYSDSGDIFLNYDNEDLILDDPNCLSIVIDGDVLICGDLNIANGQLNTITSFDASEAQKLSINETQSMHSKKRCVIRKGLIVRGSMIIPFSNLIVIGKLIVGKNAYVADLQVDLSSNFFVGILYLFSELHQNINKSSISNPFEVSRMNFIHETYTCSDSFNESIVDDQRFHKNAGTYESESRNLGSLSSSRRIYVGNNAKLWVRGDINAGEVSISDGGLIYNTCGNLKTNTTHGLGIHIRDSGNLYMKRSSILTTRISVIRSSTLKIKEGEVFINNILLLHSASTIQVGGGISFFLGLVRDSSLLYANSLVINDQIEDFENYMNNNNISMKPDNESKTKGEARKTNIFKSYLQVLSASIVSVDKDIFIQGSLEVNQGSELFSSGCINILGNVIINDGSDVLIKGKSDISPVNSEISSNICTNYSHCILGSLLVSNSSSLVIGSGNLMVNEYLDIMGGNVLLNKGLVVGKTVVSARKSGLYIKFGDLIINNSNKENENKEKSLFLSNSIFLIYGKIVVKNGDINIIMKSYLESQNGLIVNKGNLEMSTGSTVRFSKTGFSYGGDVFNNKSLIQNNVFVNGNLTVDTFSEIEINKYIIKIENIVLAANSKFSSRISKDIERMSTLQVNQVLVLQGNSFFITEGILLDIQRGVMVDEHSILYSENIRLKGDLFTDDGGIFIGKNASIYFPSIIVSQDSSKVNIGTLKVHYGELNISSLPTEQSNGYKNPIFVSENGGLIKVKYCEYICEKLGCFDSLFGITTRESEIKILKSYPSFIPIEVSSQFIEVNLTPKSSMFSQVIDPIALILRRNPEENKKIERKPKISFSKGEQIRGGRSWGIENNEEFAVNGSQPIQWQ
ncbi:PPE domain-containing protein [Cryptosporidium felis]|nr:PPE domain-containing protein [Cryptosporidium felis]